MDNTVLAAVVGALAAGIPAGIGWLVQFFATKRERQLAVQERQARLESEKRVAELTAANTRLKNIAADDLEAELAKKHELGKMVFKEGVFWDDGESTPFCPSCHVDSKKIPLQSGDYSKWMCPKCEGYFDKPERLKSDPPMPVVVSRKSRFDF